MAKIREAPLAGDGPGYVDSTEPPGTNKPPEAKKPVARLDPSLRLAAKLDRLMSEMSPWARQWALAWLQEKYPAPKPSDPL